MRLKLDVNNCFGEYSIESSSLTIGDGMACTERCCDKPIAYELGRDLTQVKSYSLDGETLTLTGPSVELVFELNK
jgi:heat shock protein HslJ